MKQTRFLLILFMVLASLTVLAGTAAAQNVDVDTMSNEELMVLLQSIMQRLEQDMVTDTEEKEPETVETSIPISAEVGSGTRETDREPKKFSSYENKKLIIGRMPDSWFIREKPGGGGGEDESDSGEDGFHYGGSFRPG